MKQLIALISLLLISHGLFAQNKASLKGTIVDSLTKTSLEYATIAVVNAKDTSLIAYTISEKSGLFRLTGLPSDKPTKLIISYIGYNTSRIMISLKPGDNNDLGQILLSGKSLNEVVIQGERSPIIMKKDTIEFNTEAFKTRPNATVEELLMILPGVQVNVDGSIVINGSGASKVLINGKPFFGNNALIATKNLDADMIDKIQVYDDRDDDPTHQQNEIDVKKIINLKLKSAIKKSTIGKLYGGVGTRNRYEGGGILSTFRDTLQVSLVSTVGNLNNTGVSYDDLNSMGGFNRSESSRVNERNFGGGYVNGFVKKFRSAFSLNNNYGEKLKLNLSYYNFNSTAKKEGKTLTEQMLENTMLTSSSGSSSKNRLNGNIVEGLFEWKPDTTNSFRYQPVFEYTPQRNSSFTNVDRFNTQNPNLSNSDINNRERILNRSFSHGLSYYHRFKKKDHTLYISHWLTLTNGGTDKFDYDNLISYTPEQPSKLFDRYSDINYKKNFASVEVFYDYRFNKKFSTELFTNSRYIMAADRSLLFDKNIGTDAYDNFVDNQSSDLGRNTFIQNVKPQLFYQVKENMNIRIGLDLEFQHQLSRFNNGLADRKQNFLLLFPALRINGKNFYLDYYEAINQPAIADMQPITREINPLYKIVGNPDLVYNHFRSLSVNFSKYIPRTKVNFNVRSSITRTSDNFAQQISLDANGATTITTINSDASTTINLNGGIGKQLGNPQKLGVSLSTNFYSSYNKSPFFFNNDKGEQRSFSFDVMQAATINYKTGIRFTTSYTLNARFVNYPGLDYRSVNIYTHSLVESGSFRLTNKLSLDTWYIFSYRPNVVDGFQKSAHILNMGATLAALKKDRAQVKLSVYDLLDQNISVYRYPGTNSIITNEQEILRRYFMISCQYKINIIKK